MISTTASFVSHIATAGQTVFSYGFCIQNTSDLKVFVETPAGVRTDITVSIVSITGVGVETGGTVTIPAQALNTKVFLVRQSALSQLWDASSLNFFDPATVERVVDKLTLLVQEALSLAAQSIRVDSGESLAALNKSQRSGLSIKFDSSGNLTYYDTAAAEASAAAAAASAAAAAADIATAATSAVAAANSATAAAASASAASASQSSAASSASSANTSKNTAVSAAAAASTSAFNAASSASDAYSYASDAVSSAANAATSESNALTSANNASASASSADSSASSAATNASIATASSSAAVTAAGNALNSQNAAAASAATALNAQATEYLGSIAGNSVPATATTKGQYYVINAAGTSQGVTWAIGDKAIYNGSSGSWSRITGFLAASNSYAEGIGATRAAGGYLYSDGATSNRAQVQTPGARGNLAGAPVASWCGWVDVPASPGSLFIFALTSSDTSPFQNNSLTARASSGLTITAAGASGVSDRRNFSMGAFFTTYGGQRIFLEVRFTKGTGNPTVRVNGIDISSSFSASTSGSAPEWLDFSLVSTYHTTGYGWPTGSAPIGQWLNAHLTDTESETWRTTGRPPVWVAAGGSTVNATGDATLVNDLAWLDPSNKFVVSGGTLTGTSVNQYEYILSQRVSGARVLSPGSRVRWKVVVSAISGGNNFVLQQGSNGTFIQVLSAATTYSGTYIASANDSLFYAFAIKNLSATSSSITISAIEWYVDGALSIPHVQPGIANVLDATLIGGNDAYLIGTVGVTGIDSLQTEATLDAKALSRASSGWVYSDGATSNRAQIQLPGTRGNLAGAPVASWVGWVDVPTSISSASCFIASLSSTASANNSTVNQLSLWTTNTGSLFIRANGATGSDTRTLSLSTFVVAYSGQRIWLEVRFTKGTSNPVVRVNGTDISFSFTASTAGTAPEWLDASLSSTNHLVGLNWPAGPAPLGQWLNAHLTDTESETWRITGRPPAWVAAGGSQNINTPENTSFEGGTVGQWSQAGNHSRSVVSDTGGLGSYALEIVATGAGSWVANAVYVTASFTRVVGQSYRVRFLAKSISGNTLLTISGNFIGTRTITTSWAEYVSDIFIPPSLGTVTIAFLLGDAGTFRVDNVRLEVLGALSLPAVQSTLVLDDVTTLGGNQARLLGMVPVTERGPVHDIQRPAESYTGGVSVSLLGGNVIGGRKRRILSITGSSSANTTISVGTSSGGTQLVNAQTVNGDFDISTFASRIVAADSQLFVTFAGTTTASVNIHLTDF